MLGEKTKRLQQLSSAGFNVPKFVAIPTEDMAIEAGELAKRAMDEIDAALYAVRSSALVEDSSKSSMAGQFMTRLAVPSSELAAAIDEVRNDAKSKLGELTKFSLFIQEFVKADYSGIAFTRNPSGDRELVIEYHSGRGDAVVGGEVKPIRETFYRTQTALSSKLPDIELARTTFLKIEELLGFPQDIEWCLRKGEWFILQSRPITSLSQDQVDKLVSLERSLPTGKFYFAKTEVCDVAPRPSQSTFELLKAMYAEGGPVQLAYRAFDIVYQDTGFLLMIENELFVDKEKELKSLFPSHSYFHGQDYVVRPGRVKGFLTSLRNTKRLQSLEGDFEALTKDLKERLESPFSKVSEKFARQGFFDDYVVIFTINLLAQRALDDLKRLLPAEVSLPEALAVFPKDLPELWQPPQGLVGNTFEFSDTSKFVVALGKPTATKIPEGVPVEPLKAAQNYLRLREYGRWLALRHINRLRDLVSSVEAPALDEYPLPPTLTDRPLPQDSHKPLGVSAGKAEGKLVTTPEAGGILVVSSLTPDIANNIKLLKGVIADHGGLLSHFAIIAREAGLPVIVNYPINELEIGSVVTIDGSTGEVVTKK